MNRLASVMALDTRLQFRNGFYYAAGFVALYCIVGLNWFGRANLAWLLPPLIFSNLMINTFYFFAGLVLLEKREGTLEAQVVTPLRTWEYLTSKLATLIAIAVVENLAIVALTFGIELRIVPLIGGMIVAAAIYTLIGFAVVARYDSINEYLFPSFVFTLLLSLPLLPYFGLVSGWWTYLHPMQAPLVLMQSAFVPVEGWETAVGLLYSLIWIVAAFFWGTRTFHRFIIAREGAR